MTTKLFWKEKTCHALDAEIVFCEIQPAQGALPRWPMFCYVLAYFSLLLGKDEKLTCEQQTDTPSQTKPLCQNNTNQQNACDVD